MITKQHLVVFSDDWGRHPSSCQHLVSHLLGDFEVIWVNTIGTRPPRIDKATVKRGVEKLWQWNRSNKNNSLDGETTPRVLNPVMWPSFRLNWTRSLNRTLINNHVSRHVENTESNIVLTTIPIVADLVGCIPNSRWIYYCVDDFSQWPGLDGTTLRAMERSLVRNADAIVAAGENLADRIRNFGREPVVITHGVALDHWKPDRSKALTTFAEIERPVVLFWGLIDRRLDTLWLKTLADSMDRGTIMMVGPQQDPDPALHRTPRLHFTGPLPYSELPAAASIADVLVMPYADLPVTRAMQPLKLKEYMATGKPVVVRRLPATQSWNEALFAVETAEDFVQSVRQCVLDGLPQSQSAARRRLSNESWATKANSLRGVLTYNRGSVFRVQP